jgi:hypothetical protein
MEGENSSILKDSSLISQPNQVIQQVEQIIPPPPSFSPPLLPPPQTNIPFNSIQNSNSSTLTNNSLIPQSALSFPFPPLLLPPVSPFTLPPPPFPPFFLLVIQAPLLFSLRILIFFNPIEGQKTYKLYPRMSRAIVNHKIKTQEKKDE